MIFDDNPQWLRFSARSKILACLAKVSTDNVSEEVLDKHVQYCDNSIFLKKQFWSCTRPYLLRSPPWKLSCWGIFPYYKLQRAQMLVHRIKYGVVANIAWSACSTNLLDRSLTLSWWSAIGIASGRSRTALFGSPGGNYGIDSPLFWKLSKTPGSSTKIIYYGS